MRRLAKHYRCEADARQRSRRRSIERQNLKPKGPAQDHQLDQEGRPGVRGRIGRQDKQALQDQGHRDASVPQRDAAHGRRLLLRHLHQEAVPDLLPHDRPEEGPGQVGLPAPRPARARGVRALRPSLQQRVPVRRQGVGPRVDVLAPAGPDNRRPVLQQGEGVPRGLSRARREEGAAHQGRERTTSPSWKGTAVSSSSTWRSSSRYESGG